MVKILLMIIQTLFIPLDSDSYLSANEQITIDGAYVIPLSETVSNDINNFEARFGLSVNDKDIDNFDNNYDGLDRSDDYMAGDDFYTYWWVYEGNGYSLGTNNNGDISYTLADGGIANEDHFHANNQNGEYPWPLFNNRTIKIIIPEKMNFAPNTSFGGSTELDMNDNKLTLNITAVRDFVIDAHYEFLAIQEPEPANCDKL